MKSQIQTPTNPLKYTDPTGYQRTSLGGASNWLGGGGGWGESGTDFSGNVDWNYFYDQNHYINPEGVSVAYNDDPPIDLNQEAISEILKNSTSAAGYMLNRVPGGFSIVGYWVKGERDHYFGMHIYSDIFLVGLNGEDPVEIAGKGSAGGGKIDWAGVTNASLSILGGAGEMIVGGAGTYFSAGIATSVSAPLIIDGGIRVASNTTRLVAYITSHSNIGNSIPGNAGAWIGKGIDMSTGKSFYDYGLGQGFGDATNDFLSFIVTGGTASPMSNMVNNYNTMNAVWYYNSYLGYTNSLFYDFYSIKKK